ncbi:hypothetical protein NDU88_006568 [Pleurodeles waltl]|uniref:Uncharacterized protein n=1 Tax=Pleurodeles waltl TaxID=8319 RepID=A0AAV7LV91_PLEWA|nr:hypothetical protein NDU88_006568 [Pleurodeles waltl]
MLLAKIVYALQNYSPPFTSANVPVCNYIDMIFHMAGGCVVWHTVLKKALWVSPCRLVFQTVKQRWRPSEVPKHEVVTSPRIVTLFPPQLTGEVHHDEVITAPGGPVGAHVHTHRCTCDAKSQPPGGRRDAQTRSDAKDRRADKVVWVPSARPGLLKALVAEIFAVMDAVCGKCHSDIIYMEARRSAPTTSYT